MQDYYEQNIFGASSTVQLSFVSTLILVFTFGGSLFSRIFELVLGTRFALLLATVLYTAGMEAAGSASEVNFFTLSKFQSSKKLLNVDLASISRTWRMHRHGQCHYLCGNLSLVSCIL